MPAELRGQRRGDQLGAVGAPSGRPRPRGATPELVQQVRVAVHVGAQLRVGPPYWLLPAFRVGQDGRRPRSGHSVGRAGQQRVVVQIAQEIGISQMHVSRF